MPYLYYIRPIFAIYIGKCAEGAKTLNMFYVADQAYEFRPAEPMPIHNGKTYVKAGDDLKDLE